MKRLYPVHRPNMELDASHQSAEDIEKQTIATAQLIQNVLLATISITIITF